MLVISISKWYACVVKKIREIAMTFKLTGVIAIFVFMQTSCSFIDDKLGIELLENEVAGSGPDKLKFVAIGDTGKGNAGQFEVAEAIRKKCAMDGCDFVLMLGDNIYDAGVSGDNDIQFQTKFEIPYKDISIPFFMVLGNHDYGGIGYDITKSIHQIEYTNDSSKWRMPRHFYKFQVQNTTFFALDTNAQMYHLAKDQKKDVPGWIERASTEWKIAFGHHPYKSNGRHGNAGSYEGVSGIPIASGEGVKEFAESVWCGKVDLYLSGHDHNRQWLAVDCNGTQLALSGAGASTTRLQGNNPTLFESDELGLLYISIDGSTLTAEFVDINGETEFTHTIEK